MQNVEYEGKFIRMGERVLPCFEALRAGATALELQQLLKGQFGLDVPDSALLPFLQRIFQGAGVIIDRSAAGDAFFIKLEEKKVQRDNDTMIRLRLTLLPERWVNAICGRLQFLFSWTAAALLASSLALAVVLLPSDGIQLLLERTKALHPSDIHYPLLVAVLTFSFLFHELGHSTASLLGGVRSGRIGFGIYWIYPVLFSDVTRIWSLAPRERVLVDLGGVYFQSFVVALLALSLSLVSADLQLTLFVCIIYNLLAIFISINPALRYDGYWVVADLLDTPNLSTAGRRAFFHICASIRRLRVPHWKQLGLASYFVFSWVYSLLFFFFLYVSLKSSLAFLAAEWRNIVSPQDSAHLAVLLAKLIFYLIPLMFLPSVIAGLIGRAKSLLRDATAQGRGAVQ